MIGLEGIVRTLRVCAQRCRLTLKKIAHRLCADEHHRLKVGPISPCLLHGLQITHGAYINQRQGKCLVAGHLQGIDPRLCIACGSGDDNAHD